MTTGIHIFRKDLRIVDNLALNALMRRVDRVIGVFIFDQTQIYETPKNKSHYSVRAAQFVIDSVNDLNQQCSNKLLILEGDVIHSLNDLIKTSHVSALSFNADFTPYAIKRDREIMKLCNRHEIEIIVNEDDQTLAPMISLIKGNATPYMVYGAFFKNLMKQNIAKPSSSVIEWLKPKVASSDITSQKPMISRTWIGGRSEALVRLKTRTATGATDNMSDETIQLSAYLNQGCISIREVYWAFKKRFKDIEPIRSIVWRDFFLCIYRFAPNGNSYTQYIDDRYSRIKWPALNKDQWNRFMSCNTGFLLVDAGLAEMIQTGFVNNRTRLLLATFWIKYLMISPFDEKYGSQVWFSKLLIDCNASQNKLNHQWILSELDLSGRRFCMKGSHPLTGRMIRIDNDMIKRYDKNYEYIKKWLPEFKGLDLKECKALMKQKKCIYEWRERYAQYGKLFSHLK